MSHGRGNIAEPGRRAPRRRRCSCLEYRARRKCPLRRPCMGWRRSCRGRGGRRRRPHRRGPARARISPRCSWARQRGGHTCALETKRPRAAEKVCVFSNTRGRIRAFLVLFTKNTHRKRTRQGGGRGRGRGHPGALAAHALQMVFELSAFCPASWS